MEEMEKFFQEFRWVLLNGDKMAVFNFWSKYQYLLTPYILSLSSEKQRETLTQIDQIEDFASKYFQYQTEYPVVLPMNQNFDQQPFQSNPLSIPPEESKYCVN